MSASSHLQTPFVHDDHLPQAVGSLHLRPPNVPPTPLAGLPTPRGPIASTVKGAVAQHTYSTFTGYSFTVNYILGVGVLGMPYAFVKGGYVLATLCLLLVTVMASLTAIWLAQTGQRAARLERRAILDMQRSGQQPLESHEGRAERFTHRRIEVNELVQIFLGRPARRVYEVLLCIYMIGALWSYSAVFSQSMEGQLPIAAIGSNYLFYLGLFALIVVPLTCLEMTELKPLAIALAIFRFVALTLMMLTAVLSLYHYPFVTAEGVQPSTATSAPYYSDVRPVVWAGLATIFPVSLFSQIFHHSVPGLTHPLQNKQRTPFVFTAVLMTTFALYAGLGICVGLYFGSGVDEVATLNWVDYSGERGVGRTGRTWVASVISYTIVLFPPIDIISAFPLNAITLANNIMSATIPPHLTTQRRYIIPFRLVAALLPLVGAAFIKSLDSILHYTGCVGVLIAFLYPTVMQWKSLKVESLVAGGGDEDDEEEGGEPPLLTGWKKELVNGKLAMASVFVFSVVGLVSVIALSIVYH